MSRYFLCVQPTTCSLSESMIWHWPSPSDWCFRFSLISEPQFSQTVKLMPAWNDKCRSIHRGSLSDSCPCVVESCSSIAGNVDISASFSAPVVEEVVHVVHDGVYPVDHFCASRILHRVV